VGGFNNEKGIAMNTNTSQVVARPRRAWERVWDWLDERLALKALAYPVSEHANTLSYLLGGITFVGFVILAITGILLTQFYHPHPDDAHDSVVYIITQAPLGDLIRSIHVWTANWVVITAILHLLRIFFTASFKRPREINWLVGVALLAMTLGFVFTGTVLKWDQEGFEALSHNREIAEILGVWGAWFSAEFGHRVPLLTRLYTAHATLLPAAFSLLLIAHLFLIKQHGISPLPQESIQAGQSPVGQRMSRFILHLRRMAGFGLILLALVSMLALVLPAPLGLPPVPGEEVTKPPWMFLPLYPLENVWGVQAILWASVVLFALLALVPFLDRSPYLTLRHRRAALVVGAIVLAILIGLTIYGAFTVPVTHVGE
jgi:ubiquinol-cytochrome c reductase cytochrome b subunit